MTASKLTKLELEAVFQYDPAQGTLAWRVGHYKAGAGDSAGCVNSATGYVDIGCASQRVYGHHVAWVLLHGAMPGAGYEIAFKDGCRSNLKADNLELRTRSLQRLLDERCGPNNSTGWKGVSRCRNRYVASIHDQGKRRRLGVYSTPEEAHAAYLTARARLIARLRDDLQKI